jgi:diacylglycerol kinase family enzyme
VERDLPFACVPLGTRNHFARDLGLDRTDPIGALSAFAGTERRVDTAEVNGRLFLNNVSLGIYASFVHDPERKTRNRLVAFARMAPAAVGQTRRPLSLTFEVGGKRAERRALVLLVANNDYHLTAMADLGGRSRLDEGLLHAYVIEAAKRKALLALLAASLLGREDEATGWVEWAAASFRVESRRPRLHAAIDGEPVVVEPPLEFAIRPRGLRVLLPA